MIRSMRRVLLAIVAVVALVAVSFGVGWFVSGADQRSGGPHAPAVAQLKPLPVPRVIIPNGPWADPHAPAIAPVDTVPQISRGFVASLFLALGVDIATGGFVVRRGPS
jgi:hypothetical protein